MSQPLVIVCQCASGQAQLQKTALAVCDALHSAGVEFQAVTDLCALAATRDPLLGEIAGRDGIRIVACQPRAVKWLFVAGAAPLREDAVVCNMRMDDAGCIVIALVGTRVCSEDKNVPARIHDDRQECLPHQSDNRQECLPHQSGDRQECPPHQSPAWFPVIDFGRCDHCMQCLSFCLFDVYGLQDKRVEVKNPANCKPDCPACAGVPTGGDHLPQARQSGHQWRRSAAGGGQASGDEGGYLIAAGRRYLRIAAAARWQAIRQGPG